MDYDEVIRNRSAYHIMAKAGAHPVFLRFIENDDGPVKDTAESKLEMHIEYNQSLDWNGTDFGAKLWHGEVAAAFLKADGHNAAVMCRILTFGELLAHAENEDMSYGKIDRMGELYEKYSR